MTTVRAQPVPRRADAQRNRERLLQAADALFSERGADVSMDDIARHAGVGIGTLYRHFATRAALLAATVEDQLLTLAARDWAGKEAPATGAGAMAAPGATAAALATFLEALACCGSTYCGLAASLGIVLESDTPGCVATKAAGRRLLEAAQAAGEIRAAVDFVDVVCMATAIALTDQQQPRSDPGRIRRLVSLFVDGLRMPLPSPPSSHPPRSSPSPHKPPSSPCAPSSSRKSPSSSGKSPSSRAPSSLHTPSSSRARSSPSPRAPSSSRAPSSPSSRAPSSSRSPSSPSPRTASVASASPRTPRASSTPATASSKRPRVPPSAARGTRLQRRR